MIQFHIWVVCVLSRRTQGVGILISSPYDRKALGFSKAWKGRKISNEGTSHSETQRASPSRQPW